MRPSFTRRYRRRSTPTRPEGGFFKKEGQQEQNFLGDSSHDTFFQPVSQGQTLQRKSDNVEEEKKVQRAEDKKEEEKIQKKDAGTSSYSGKSLNNYVSSLSGKGQPLSSQANYFFSSKMGYDFSDVRVHNDKAAAESAKDVNAKAYTVGNNIVFNEGQYNMESSVGKRLMAHELTHVIQQGNDIKRKTDGDHNLTNPRFSGDLVLESCYDNEQVLASGSSGEPVRKVQQALMDAGFSLPVYGADGVFGSETKTAVINFQTASLISVDGIVGPQTMGKLDELHTKSSSQSSTMDSSFDPSCNDIQQKIIGLILDKAKKLVDNALVRMMFINMFESGGTDKNYLRWFGTFEKSRAKHVLRSYQLISKALENVIVFNCGCDRNIYAHVFPGLKLKIHLCKLFWSAPYSGFDSKPGVIIHELSHEVLRGGDFRYSVEKAEHLAQNFPWLAVRNADNYEYFAESV